MVVYPRLFRRVCFRRRRPVTPTRADDDRRGRFGQRPRECHGGGCKRRDHAQPLLSATHPDTVVAAPVLGDLIAASGTPAWARLAGNTTAPGGRRPEACTPCRKRRPRSGPGLPQELPGRGPGSVLPTRSPRALGWFPWPADSRRTAHRFRRTAKSRPCGSNRGTLAGCIPQRTISRRPRDAKTGAPCG